MTSLRTVLALSLALASCRDAPGKHAAPAATGSAVAAGSAAQAGSAAGSGSAAVMPTGVNPNDYIPAENKEGMARWRDTGVYVDGKPVAFLNFDELPISLQPVWVKDKVSQNKPPGCPTCLDWKWSEQRFYRFTDYLKALGIDIHKVKMMHVIGPKLEDTIAVTGKDLASAAANEFMFHFGGDISGKPIPHVPPNFGNRMQPDKINGVLIYIDRKPPTITRDGIELDGVPQDGVPYYGEPLRGGIRIYLDDHLAAIIKRQDLDVKKATTTPDGELHWGLAQFLADKGVDTSKVVEGWVIREGLRHEEIAWKDLSKMTFSAGDKAHGGVLLGDDNLQTHVLALHTRVIRHDELPVIHPDEMP